MRIITWALACASVLVATATVAIEIDPFAAAVEKAKANEDSEPGRTYVGPLVDSLKPSLEKSLKHCFPKGSKVSAAGSTFTVVLLVNAQGALTEKMGRPTTPNTECVLAGLGDAHVAPPPAPDWWVYVHLKIEE